MVAGMMTLELTTRESINRFLPWLCSKQIVQGAHRSRRAVQGQWGVHLPGCIQQLLAVCEKNVGRGSDCEAAVARADNDDLAKFKLRSGVRHVFQGHQRGQGRRGI